MDCTHYLGGASFWAGGNKATGVGGVTCLGSGAGGVGSRGGSAAGSTRLLRLGACRWVFELSIVSIVASLKILQLLFFLHD